ncbi:MAG: ABC transporter permease [Anaerolineae bacterium]|nr:ABC transporter permease [Thermoflexus sp.]MDW8064521.1 ABC transporter permease [Anaerolineae bacterium]
MTNETMAPQQAEAFRTQTVRRHQIWTVVTRTLTTMAMALGMGFVITALVSPRPLQAYTALLTGPLSSPARIGIWMEDATGLILLGLAFTLVFQARQFSLLAEGQLHLGALVAGIVALHLPLPIGLHLGMALLAAMAAGFLYGLIPGALKAYLGASELVASLMLNVIAQRFYELLLTYWLRPPGAGYNWTDPFPATAILWRPIPDVRINIGLPIALMATALVWLLIYRSSFGYELRVVGANPEFARYVGIPLRRVILLGIAVSGIPAGLAGAYLAMGVHHRLILNISLGLGFEGIVVALLARNNPAFVPLAAFAYSYLRIGGDIMERTAAVGSDLVRLIQAVIILFLTAEALFEQLSHWIARRRHLHVGS